MFIFADMSLIQLIQWIIYIIVPILALYLVYLVLTRAFTYLGFSNLESTIIVIVSFIFTFPIIIKGFDISNIALLSYNGWIIGINTGGALIPIFISLYLIIKRNISWKYVGIATLVVTIMTYFVTSPEPDKGIVSVFPFWLLPVIVACFASIILFKKNFSKGAVIAYSSSTFGVIIGADFLHLPELLGYYPTKLGTMATIGGAVVFDLIFLTGVIAVLFYGTIMYKYRTNN